MRSGSPAAFFTAVSRTPASASKVSMNSAVAMSLGPIGTRALAPIMRSGTGALGSTCFWKLVGRTSSGSGHVDGGAPCSVMVGNPNARLVGSSRLLALIALFFQRRPGRIEPLLREPPAQLSDPSVEKEAPGEPGKGG